MSELLLVKDGLYLGRPKVSPGLADGLYLCDGSQATPCPEMVDRGLHETIDEERAISAEGWLINLNSWPLLAPGLSVRVFRMNGDRYSNYFLVEGETDLADRLANWWAGWGKKKFWVSGKRRQMLNPRRITYAKVCKVEHVVNTETTVGLQATPEYCKVVAAKLEEQLHQTEAVLNGYLAPIGGKVTKLLPYWQRYLPMVWVLFKINGVDPTKGQGCLCYPNGDFYYGPWCQRLGQHNTDAATHMLYEYPPSYTMVDWITGPLYEASQRYNKGDYYFSGRQQLPKFEPTGFMVGVYGEAKKDHKDDTFQRALRNTPRGEVAIDMKMLKNAVKSAERLPETNGNITVLQKWNMYWGLLCTNGRDWVLQLSNEYYDKGLEEYFKRWGKPYQIIPDEEFMAGDQYGCRCDLCDEKRNDVRRIYKEFMTSLGINPDQLQEKISWEAVAPTVKQENRYEKITWAEEIAQEILEENLKAMEENIPF